MTGKINISTNAAALEALRVKLAIQGGVAGSFTVALPTGTIATDRIYQYAGVDNTTIGGIDWRSGDGALYNGTTWSRIPAITIATNGVQSTHVSALAYGKPFIMPGLVLPNYDTATKTLSFNSDATYKCMLFYKNTKYDIPVGTTVVDGQATSAVQLIFDTTNSTFSFVGHSIILTETQLRVAVYKRYSGFYQWDFPCDLTINGNPMMLQNGNPVALGSMAIVSSSGVVNFDFTNLKMVFPNTGNNYNNIIWKNKFYAVPDNTEVDLTNLANGARGVVYFNTVTNAFSSRNTTQLTTVSLDDVMIAAWWITTKKVVMLGNYTVDGGDIPTYFSNEVLDTVKKVEANSLNKSLVYSLITDSHFDGINYFGRTTNNIKEVNRFIKSDAIVHLGDIVDGNLTFDQTKAIMDKAYGLMRDTNLPVFALIGNHDDNSYSSSLLPSNLVTKEKWFGISQRQTDMIVVRPDNKPYFYIDYPKLKVRTVILCAIDYVLSVDGGGLAVQYGANFWGYGIDQLNWLGETALNTENDYGVLIFSHLPTRAELNYTSADNINRGAIVEAILQAYTNKTSYTYVEGSKTFDYSAKTGVEMIAYFYGHTHGDSAKIPVGLSFPCISIANSSPSQIAANLLPVDSVAPVRVVNTLTADCWDVMTLRRDERKIYLTRFGAGNDRVVTY